MRKLLPTYTVRVACVPPMVTARYRVAEWSEAGKTVAKIFIIVHNI